jgi:hypothetical protein
MALMFVVGPQLAVNLRIVECESVKSGGKIFYQLALGGILLALLITLLQWAIFSSGFTILLTLR